VTKLCKFLARYVVFDFYSKKFFCRYPYSEIPDIYMILPEKQFGHYIRVYEVQFFYQTVTVTWDMLSETLQMALFFTWNYQSGPLD